LPFPVWDYLRKRADINIGPWKGGVRISKAAIERDAKAALKVARFAAALAVANGVDRLLVIVPEDPIYNSRIHFTARSGDEHVLVAAVRSISSCYGYPYSFEPEPYMQKVVPCLDCIVQEPVMLHEIALDGPFRISFDLQRHEGGFEFTTASSPEGSAQLPTKDQIRRAINSANPQLKAGLVYQDAPAIVFVVQSGIGYEIRMAVAAAFGDIAYTFSRDNFENGQMVPGPNASFRPDLNTSISALVCCHEQGVPLVVHNPWARNKLEPGVLANNELTLVDGHVTKVRWA